MKEKLILNKNAKQEEIKAYKVLKDIFFNNKTAIVGDSPKNYLPDIYTSDYSIGVEVTSCEHISQFLKENKREIKNNDAKYVINFYDNMSLKDKNIFFNAEFEKVLEKKIKKISNYKSCKSINLIIMSDNENKSYIRRESLAKIYHDLIDKHKVRYDNLFLYYNNILYLEINYNFIKLKKINLNTLEK